MSYSTGTKMHACNIIFIMTAKSIFKHESKFIDAFNWTSANFNNIINIIQLFIGRKHTNNLKITKYYAWITIIGQKPDRFFRIQFSHHFSGTKMFMHISLVTKICINIWVCVFFFLWTDHLSDSRTNMSEKTIAT